jgi:hypothetical protein
MDSDQGRVPGEDRLAVALDALRRGWVLTPLSGKKPLLNNWTKLPPATEEQVRGWIAHGHNLGLRTGAVSGVTVIDDDTEDGSGARNLGLPETVTGITGSGKRHFFFKTPKQPIGNSASRLHKLVDVRGDGGQVVFVGSLHPETDQPYRWLEGHSPDEIELAEMPPHIIDQLGAGESPANGHGAPRGARSRPAPHLPLTASADHGRATRWAEAALRNECARVACTPEGERNNALNRAAFCAGQVAHLLARDPTEELLAAGLSAGLPEGEARATIASGLGAGKLEPRSPAEPPEIEIVNGSVAVHQSDTVEAIHASGKVPAEPPLGPELDQDQVPPERPDEIATLDDAHALLEQAKAAEDVMLLFKRAKALAALSREELAMFLQAAKDAFKEKLAKTELVAAIEAHRKAQDEERKEKEAEAKKHRRAASRARAAQALHNSAKASRRREVELFEDSLTRDPKAIHDDAVAALVAGNSPEYLFAREGRPARIGPGQEGHPAIEELDEKEMQAELIKRAIFIGRSRNGEPQPVDPPPPTIRTLLGCGNLPFPKLAGIVRSPVFRPDGSILLLPGYDRATGLYHNVEPGLVVPAVSEAPSPDEIREARDLTLQIFCQFPFAGESSRANAVALLFTTFLQPIVNDNRPLAVVSAREAGSGKGLIAESCAGVVTGCGPRATRFTREEEFEKKVAHLLAVGTRFILIDNAKRRLESETLESILTLRRFSDRTFGHNDRGFDVPQDATWCANGNNIELGTEIARRSYLIELNAGVAHPENRAGPRPGEVFKRLPEWVAANRGRLIWAVLTLGRAWWSAGQPRAKLAPFGNFERWQEVHGGVLEVAGIPEFLGNRRQLRVEQDEENTQWGAFLREAWRVLGSREFLISVIAAHIQAAPALQSSLPDELVGFLGKPNFAQMLGMKLRQKAGRRFGGDGLRVERLSDEKHEKVGRWVLKVDQQGGADETA